MSEVPHFEQYRNVEVQGAIGKIIFRAVPMPLEVAQEVWDRGGSVPLDVAPSELWWEPGQEFPRFGEEMLGKDF